ncbi:GMC oxidoreductase [Nocardia sp. 348MFTsu5.1]|uniref:GMC oxidoreductase n=1 Tax=Nocardia sp. 348MFTsu5.1 TaxID=1172185 RepID=UPI00036D4DC0|nr:GMC oxidoreductase [Nocardia sp. 348MFTsu5.1]
MSPDTTITSRRTVLKVAAAGAAVAAAAAVSSRAAGGATAGGSAPTAVVIGSGFGGAVAALRLGQAGISTTVLERGRRWPIRPDGNTFATVNQPDGRAAWFSTKPYINGLLSPPIAPYPGLIDRIFGNGVDAIYGTGVGGGSLAFGMFTSVPRRVDFDMIFPAFANYDELVGTYYPRAKKVLGTSPLPADILAHPQYRGARAFLNTLRDYGTEPIPTDFAVDWDVVRDELRGLRKASVSVGEGPYGINSGAKNSVDRNYLPAAEATGNVTIKPMHEVFDIRPRERAKGFVVTAREIDDSHNTVRVTTFEADYLFMAAGSYYTTSLLVSARARGTLPALSTSIGQGWGTNGDFLILRTPLREDHGALQGGPGNVKMYEDRLPGGPVAMNYQATPFPEYAGGFSTTNLIQTHTDERGTIDYDQSTSKTVLNFPHPRENTLVDQRASQFAWHFHEQTEVRYGYPANGLPIYPQAADFGAACTYHGLGGVVMGQGADENGKVRGYDNLYVVDGSFLPGAAGLVNPSLTITAITERTMDRFVATL